MVSGAALSQGSPCPNPPAGPSLTPGCRGSPRWCAHPPSPAATIRAMIAASCAPSASASAVTSATDSAYQSSGSAPDSSPSDGPSSRSAIWSQIRAHSSSSAQSGVASGSPLSLSSAGTPAGGCGGSRSTGPPLRCGSSGSPVLYPDCYLRFFEYCTVNGALTQRHAGIWLADFPVYPALTRRQHRRSSGGGSGTDDADGTAPSGGQI